MDKSRNLLSFVDVSVCVALWQASAEFLCPWNTDCHLMTTGTPARVPENCWWCKCEDLSSDPSTLLNSCLGWSMPVTPTLGTETVGFLGLLPVSPANQWVPGLERKAPQSQVGMTEEDTRCWGHKRNTCTHMWLYIDRYKNDANLCMCVYDQHIYTQTETKREYQIPSVVRCSCGIKV